MNSPYRGGDHPPRNETTHRDVSPPEQPPNNAGLSPILSIKHRPGYQRISSVSEDFFASTTFNQPNPDYLPHVPEASNTPDQGLGLQNVQTHRSHSISRVPVGSKRGQSPSSSIATPTSADYLLSPPSRLPSSTLPDLKEHVDEFEDLSDTKQSSHSAFQPVNTASTAGLTNNAGSMGGLSPIPSGFDMDFKCPAQKVHYGRGGWLAITILVLSIYSTAFSGLWLGIAIARPRYGRRISTTGSLPPATASILFAAFAKSIELSFVTVFVALLGQVLSRRAFRTKSKGITIAEMTMRSWVMQPGTMLTHWETIRYAGLTLLGVIALLTALMAMIYTTASDALVTPKLRHGKEQYRTLYGSVASQFANFRHVQENCQTPIAVTDDPEFSGQTCISLEHAGQAYHNYMQWLSAWTDSRAKGNGTSQPAGRPPPVGILYDNTTVRGSWLDSGSMTDLSAKHGRIVNNVTSAMPHTGLFAAARDPRNGILQPQDLNGLGEYQIEASIPSPSVNVLCAQMNEEELAPLIYSEWPAYKNTNQSNMTQFLSDVKIPTTPDWLNETIVDDLFEFGEKYNRRPPLFPKYPKPYNTLLNSTLVYADSLYLLAGSPDLDYMLCSFRVSHTTNCSSVYNASIAGGWMHTHCNDTANQLAYEYRDPNATDGVISKDWAAGIAGMWAMSLSLGTGLNDENASNARLLTQLIPKEAILNPSLPSIAEALAVLVGCTLMLSTVDAPFIHFWNYSTTVPKLEQPQYQSFPGTLRTQEYGSGAVQSWQGIFYVVLVAVFLTNLFCLLYFLWRGDMVTDFIEPQNLFALAVNSPPSRKLEGSCGAGPNQDQIQGNWFIKLDPVRDHIFIQDGNGQIRNRKSHGRRSSTFEMMSSPIAQTYSKLSNTRSSLL